MKHRQHLLAVLALFCIASAWGVSFTIVKTILRAIAPEPFLFFRFTLAGIALLTLAAFRRELTPAIIKPGLLLGTLVFIAYETQTRGLLFISSSRSAFLTGLYVVMVPFADRLLFRVRIPLRAWIGSVFAVVGTTLLIGGVEMKVQWGDWLTIICAVACAVHVVLSAKFSMTRPATGLAAVQVMFVGLASGIPTLAGPPTHFTPAVIGVIVATAIVTTALAFVALMWSQARVTATEAAVILSFEPLAASVASIVFEHEPVTLPFVSGALLILAAMIVSQVQAAPR